MSAHNIVVAGGSTVRLPTAGKYCDRDIVVTAESGGVELPDLSSPGAAADLMAGKQLINEAGNVVDGTFTLESEMDTQVSLIERIKAALKGKASGNAEPVIKPLEITENGIYTAPEGVNGYSPVTVNVEASGGSDLPAGYTQIDFIEFNGKQLVDTGIIGNQDTRIQVSFTWGGSTQNHVYGCASSDNTASITSYTNGSWRFGAKSATKTVMKNNTLLPYVARVDKTMIGITGSNTVISDVAEFETIATLLLGGARNANGELPSSGIVGRVLYFYLWQGDEQVMKLVPVVSDDGVYRFYDKISKAFFDSMTDVALGGGNL